MKTQLIGLLITLVSLPLCAQTPPSYELVADGLDIPWGMAWLPNGDMLVTEKKGDIRVIRNGVLLEEKIKNPPKSKVQGQGGLLDIAVHPDFESNQWIYFSYASDEGGGKGANTMISRARLEGMQLTNHEILYKAEPNTSKGQHFGSRLEFDREGYLYFTVGDRGDRDTNPQDFYRDCGKIYRILDDGSIPDDNPFAKTPGAKTAIYSYGHRNPQGMALHPETGQIWTNEHGPRGGDELNKIESGKNYGWPVISYGINYNGTKFTDITEKQGMEQPVFYWVPSIAPSGLAFVSGEQYPSWKGDALVGSLKFQYLVHLDMEGGSVKKQTNLFEGIGRVRNIEQGPDGLLYFAVESKGIYRVKPFAD